MVSAYLRRRLACFVLLQEGDDRLLVAGLYPNVVAYQRARQSSRCVTETCDNRCSLSASWLVNRVAGKIGRTGHPACTDHKGDRLSKF